MMFRNALISFSVLLILLLYACEKTIIDPPKEPPAIQTAVEDTDNDGVPDSSDHCPNDPEDKDGIQDEDGCPEEDADNDGILDPVDHCPLDPETVNGFEDDDGCPDVAPEPEYDENSGFKEIFGNTTTTISADPISGSASVSFIGVCGVENDTDDDYNFRMTPTSPLTNSFVSTGGRSSGYWQIATASYELPPWANVIRETITLTGSKDSRFKDIKVPDGCEGFGIIENQAYFSNGDDDAWVMWRSFSVGDHVVFFGATDRGNSGGIYTARCTVVYWEKGRNVGIEIGRTVVGNNSSSGLDLIGCEATFASLTAYSTEYQPGLFDQVDAEIRNQAKNRVNPIAFNALGLSLGANAITVDPAKIAQIISILRTTVPIILNLFGGDPFDDDFSAVFTRNSCGGRIFVSGGNEKSAAELTVYNLNFNP